MPMGNVKGGINCQVCIDCEPMVSPSRKGYRCYGENQSLFAPMKKDFAMNRDMPPKKAPSWCPHRH
jgi:hypothetical protein